MKRENNSYGCTPSKSFPLYPARLVNESITTSSVPALTIYKDLKWKFEIIESLKCVFCKDILLDAVQTECGCRYCKECIEEYLGNGKKACLGEYEDCKTVITSYNYDRATNKEITLLKVKCVNDKCLFEDTLKDIKNHLDVCEYREESCLLCGMNYVKNAESNHLEKECLLREIRCGFCHSDFTFKEFTESHLNYANEDLCFKYVEKCPHGCTGEKEVNLRDHRRVCQSKPYKCPLYVFGCKLFLPMEEMTEHLTKNNYEHSSTFVEELHKLRKENKEKEEIINNLNNENKLLKISNKMLNKENQNCSSNINLRLPELSLKERITHVFRNGNFIWKIFNFSKRKEDAKNGRNVKIVSDAFYTSEFGYKLCIKIYPYGEGASKGTHLAVFLSIMKGEYDDILSWPFKQKVKITIINDVLKSGNHSETFKTDGKLNYFIKPENKFNNAWGIPQFITFRDLDNILKNDTLYIKAVVTS